jgi:hypothetical protein
LTTVPSSVLPWEVHSQNPPTGIVVAQASLPAWQILAAEALPPSATAIAAAPKYETTRMRKPFRAGVPPNN